MSQARSFCSWSALLVHQARFHKTEQRVAVQQEALAQERIASLLAHWVRRARTRRAATVLLRRLLRRMCVRVLCRMSLPLAVCSIV
jgi:hypothetical protein